MERETKTLKTPLGKELVVKAWLTAGERRKIQVIMQSTDVTDMSMEKLLTAQDVLMEVSVVSYEGSADCVVSRLLDARSDEYDFVSAEVAKLIAPLPTAK